MASNTVSLNTYKAILLAKTPSITVGATSKTFDGTTSISFSMNEIMGASTNAYFYRGDKTWSNSLTGGLELGGNLSFTNSGTAFRGINYGTMGDNDQWRIGGAATSSNAGYMEIATADDGTEPIYVRQYTGVFSTLKRTLTLLDGSGNTTLPGRLFVTVDSDVSPDSSTGSIVIGSTTGLSIGIDANEIMCRSSNAASTLYIQNEGGAVQMGAPLSVSSTITASSTIHANGGYLKSTLNSNTVTIGSQNTSFCHFTNSANIPFWFNKTVYADGDVLPYGNNEHNCGNSSNKWAHMYCQGRVYLDEWIQFSGATGLYWPNNNGAHLYANNVSSYGGLVTQGSRGGYCGIHLGPNTNYMTVMSTEEHQGLFSQTKRWIIYFTRSGDRIGIGDSSTTSGYICQINGACKVTSNLLVNSNNTTGGGIILSDDGDIVDLNDGYCAMRFSYGVRIFSANRGGSATITLASGGNITASALYPSGSPGSNCYFGAGNGDGNGSGTANIVIRSWYGVGFMNGCTAAGTNGAVTAGVDCRSGHIYANAVHNAVWNDYAECRKADIIEGGYCVTETPDGSMMKTTERLQPGCKLTSDTYGSIMGETDEAKTPIAVAGRVLVYPYHNRNDYPLGAAVCSAPNGTIDIMTRDEIIMYPERIVGTVSEIPTYTIWRAGGKDTGKDIEVNGRIWIYVK